MALAAEALPDTLPYLAELVLHAAIPADEFVRERQVVLEEIRQAHDDPDWIGFQAMSEQVFPDHAYGRPVLGTEAVLSQRSPEEMRCFHQAHYQPDNMTIVITGGVPLEPTLEMVRHAFRAFPSPPSCLPSQVGRIDTWWGVRRQVLHIPRLEHARLTMTWLGPGIEDLDGACGMDILSALLAAHCAARRGAGVSLALAGRAGRSAVARGDVAAWLPLSSSGDADGGAGEAPGADRGEASSRAAAGARSADSGIGGSASDPLPWLVFDCDALQAAPTDRSEGAS